MLTAGSLNQRVKLKRFALAKDDRGQDIEQWLVVGQPWAKVEMQGGSEAVNNLQATAKATWMVTLRWRPDLSTAAVIEYDDGFKVHTLAIVAIVDKYQRREELVLTCVEEPAR